MTRRELTVPVLIVAVAVMLQPSTLHAYVGPGGVITAIGAMLALFAAIVASLVGFLWFPLKRLLIWVRTLRKPADAPVSSSETAGG